MATNRFWTAKPFLVAYVIAIGFTLGVLVNRTPSGRMAVPAVAGSHGETAPAEREVREPPLWLQLFRPSPPTARWLLRMGLPVLRVADGSAQQAERRSMLVYWTGRSGERPQTFFQTLLPFLKPTPNRPTVEQPNSGGPGQPGTPGPSAGGPPEPAATPVAVNDGQPLIGIYHTHDWESYISEFPALKIHAAADLGKVESPDHSLRTVSDIGKTVAVRLAELGVTTVFADYTHWDYGYAYAYSGSRNTARKLLKEHPSVKVLLDLHRDSGYGMDLTTTVGGKKVAQVRCIIGSRNSNWEQNKAFCEKLTQRLEAKHPGMTLLTRIQDDMYNQDLMAGAILLEIGGALNQFDEANRAGVYLAEALAEIAREGAYPR